MAVQGRNTILQLAGKYYEEQMRNAKRGFLSDVVWAKMDVLAELADLMDDAALSRLIKHAIDAAGRERRRHQ